MTSAAAIAAVQRRSRYAINFPDPLEGYAEVPIIATVRPWVAEGITTLEGNELIRYQEHADEAANRISRLFKTTFIHELNSRLGQFHSDMEKLSAALRTRPLHGATYRLVELVKPEFDDPYGRLPIEASVGNDPRACRCGQRTDIPLGGHGQWPRPHPP